MATGRRILVIKLGALGDFVQALAPFAAIRDHHPNDQLTLMTTAPFQSLAEACGLFDAVWLDERPRWTQPLRWLALAKRLRSGGFDRVYDLQTSARSSRYFRLFGAAGRPEWSGIAAGCSHPHANPRRDALHTRERQAEQLSIAGIVTVPPPNLEWLDTDIGIFELPMPYALLAPGGAAHRPDKRWPAARFGDLAAHLTRAGITPVFIGADADATAVNAAMTVHGAAINLMGRTSLLQIAGLARRAAVAVGNDTGPMHIAAVVGAPSVVLYSHASDPALCAQRGERVAILRRLSLDDLSLDDVQQACDEMMAAPDAGLA